MTANMNSQSREEDVKAKFLGDTQYVREGAVHFGMKQNRAKGNMMDATKFPSLVIEKQQRLFFAAYEAHNKLMEECMDGKGIDRHLYGLRKVLESLQRESAIKIHTPDIFLDEAWKISGGDGNYLLSTSFTGYMGENDEVGSYGYVSAMRPDCYGTFYRIGRDSVQLVITDWCKSKSNLDVYGENIKWSLAKLSSLFEYNAKI
ncbi:hypothetical protein DICVIV_06567 [Dictyocaulus viviparus]|uniref:Choline/carnitine acyltransferase domain-containing protein n=1 Tax=Dictyocaulus viviparus TaxID=29172 RepID=A0A0D8XU71_DICVI|nr:hypothetical protein DICVIV_06567 [Dictyocaulus viviparus]